MPTQGSITEHILRAHFQANIWVQDTVAVPSVLDPVSLGWKQLDDGCIVPPVPEAVVDLVKCSCITSKCIGWCSCKTNDLACTELCKCEGAEE